VYSNVKKEYQNDETSVTSNVEEIFLAKSEEIPTWKIFK